MAAHSDTVCEGFERKAVTPAASQRARIVVSNVAVMMRSEFGYPARQIFMEFEASQSAWTSPAHVGVGCASKVYLTLPDWCLSMRHERIQAWFGFAVAASAASGQSATPLVEQASHQQSARTRVNRMSFPQTGN
jgi:hypothetical protein